MDTLIFIAWAAALPITYVALVEIVDRLNQWNINRKQR